jgi:FKBP-type peptidyl-prolyl cis-trans isomerase
MNLLKKILWTVGVLSLFFGSCKKEEEPVDTILEAQKNKEWGESFLQEKKSQAGVYEDPSGLLYEIFIQGTGAKPGAKDTVVITYNGYFIDNRQFVTMTEKKAMEDMTEGFHIGLRHMNEGSTYRLYIPYYLAYGTRSLKAVYDKKEYKIKEYSALIYDITLDSIIFVE